MTNSNSINSPSEESEMSMSQSFYSSDARPFRTPSSDIEMTSFVSADFRYLDSFSEDDSSSQDSDDEGTVKGNVKCMVF